MIRLMRANGGEALNSPEAIGALREAGRALQESLGAGVPAAGVPGVPGLELLPAEPPAEDLLPWLLRRLQVAAAEGPAIARAANAALAALGNSQTMGYKAASGGTR